MFLECKHWNHAHIFPFIATVLSKSVVITLSNYWQKSDVLFSSQSFNRAASHGERIKAGVHLKAVFWLGIMFLMQISRLRFRQSRICSLITHIYVLRRFVNFLVIFRFIWRQIVFLKGLVKFMEIGNFEDLVLF